MKDEAKRYTPGGYFEKSVCFFSDFFILDIHFYAKSMTFLAVFEKSHICLQNREQFFSVKVLSEAKKGKNCHIYPPPCMSKIEFPRKSHTLVFRSWFF